MAPLDATGLFVETFREGLLSALGHDLCIAAESFELRLDQGTLTGSVDLASLRVLGCMRHGRLDRSAPSAHERAEIEERMRAEILEVARYPDARVRGVVRATGEAFTAEGTLELHGRSQPFSAQITRAGEELRASVELRPSRFGITPFRALGGALRIADRVVVRVVLRTDEAQPGLDLAALTGCWQRGRS